MFYQISPNPAQSCFIPVSCELMVQEVQDLKHEKRQLQQTCGQQEQALQEMGLHLSQSVLLILESFV